MLKNTIFYFYETLTEFSLSNRPAGETSSFTATKISIREGTSRQYYIDGIIEGQLEINKSIAFNYNKGIYTFESIKSHTFTEKKKKKSTIIKRNEQTYDIEWKLAYSLYKT